MGVGQDLSKQNRHIAKRERLWTPGEPAADQLPWCLLSPMKLGMGVVPDGRWPRYVLKQPVGGPRILAGHTYVALGDDLA